MISKYVRFFEDYNELDYYKLTPLLEGKSIIAYHGTTAYFKKFDISQSKRELNNKYYGDGIFFTTDKNVAQKYANANRNIGFPISIIKDLKTKNKEAGDFLYDLWKYGNDTWELPKYQKPNKFGGIGTFADGFNGIDANDLADIAEYIIGTKLKRGSTNNDFINIFDTSTGMPYYMYELVEEIGLDKLKYYPKIYTVKLQSPKVVVASNKKEVDKAKKDKQDAVVYTGKDMVDDIPEIAVFDANIIKILKVENGMYETI